MRVSFLLQYFDPEPGAIRGLPLARQLVREGIDVEVITGFPNYPGGKVYPGYHIRPWQREMMDGVSVLRLPLYPSHSRNPLSRVANYGSFAIAAATLAPFLTQRPDVSYVCHPPPTIGIAARALQARHHAPFVYNIADMWPESVTESGMLDEGPLRNVATALISKYCDWVYSHATAITVLSPGFKRLLVERGVPSEKIEIIYNWADDDLFKPLPRDERLAAELGLGHKFNVIYAGNFGAFQGLETVIEAAASVRDLEDVQLVFVGTGVEEPRLKAKVAELGLSNVVFVGRRPMTEMPQINALADVLLVHLRDLPFFAATIPSKTQVSLASARPIIMAVRGDSADIILRAKCGEAIPPEDPAAMAGAIRRLHAMPKDAREALGVNGYNFYLQEMSLAVGARRTLDLFRDVASRRTASS